MQSVYLVMEVVIVPHDALEVVQACHAALVPSEDHRSWGYHRGQPIDWHVVLCTSASCLVGKVGVRRRLVNV